MVLEELACGSTLTETNTLFRFSGLAVPSPSWLCQSTFFLALVRKHQRKPHGASCTPKPSLPALTCGAHGLQAPKPPRPASSPPAEAAGSPFNRRLTPAARRLQEPAPVPASVRKHRRKTQDPRPKTSGAGAPAQGAGRKPQADAVSPPADAGGSRAIRVANRPAVRCILVARPRRGRCPGKLRLPGPPACGRAVPNHSK